MAYDFGLRSRAGKRTARTRVGHRIAVGAAREVCRVAKVTAIANVALLGLAEVCADLLTGVVRGIDGGVATAYTLASALAAFGPAESIIACAMSAEVVVSDSSWADRSGGTCAQLDGGCHDWSRIRQFCACRYDRPPRHARADGLLNYFLAHTGSFLLTRYLD